MAICGEVVKIKLTEKQKDCLYCHEATQEELEDLCGDRILKILKEKAGYSDEELADTLLAWPFYDDWEDGSQFYCLTGMKGSAMCYLMSFDFDEEAYSGHVICYCPICGRPLNEEEK